MTVIEDSTLTNACRELVKANMPGYRNMESADSDVNAWFRKVYSLALLPITRVLPEWETFKSQSNRPNHTGIKKFCEYFDKNYIRGYYSSKLWNHFETKGCRTTNNIEGFNLKLRNFVGAKSPNI
jgi:hypothetical protein